MNERRRRASFFLVVSAVVAVTAVVRVRLAGIPLERDEGEYAYAAQLILDGTPPYALAYNMKFPGTYYAYAAIMGVLGESPWAIRIGLLLISAATTLVLYGLARRLLDEMPAAVAGSVFALLSVDRGVMGTFAHATHFILLPMLGGLALLLRAEATGGRLRFFAAGACFGLAVLMKQQAAAFALLAVVLALRPAWAGRSRDVRAGLERAGLIVSGIAAPLVLALAVLAAQGVLDRFWFWTFQYARAYVSEVSIADAPGVFAEAWAMVTVTSLPVWILAGLGLLALALVRQTRDRQIVLAGLTGASVLAVLPGFYFRPHYFVLLLPAVALLCGVAASSIAAIASVRAPHHIARAIALATCLAAVAVYVVADRRYLFTSTAVQVHRALYAGSPFMVAPAIATYLREHTSPGERIAVLGSEPEIYFYADRKAATGYIYMYGLMEPQPYAARMQREMIGEIEAAGPAFIVDVRSHTSWLTRSSSERLVLSWMRRYLDTCYTPVGVAEATAAGAPDVRWDEAARGWMPRGETVIYTYRRTGGATCRATPAS